MKIYSISDSPRLITGWSSGLARQIEEVFHGATAQPKPRPVGKIPFTTGFNEKLQKYIAQAKQKSLDKNPSSNNNSVMSQNIKLSTAVLVAIRDLAKSQPTFSLHDVTKKLRESVNDGSIVLTDKTPEDVNGITTFKIEHNEVRDIFNDLYSTQVISLNRKDNGRYFEYSTTVLNAPNASAPKPQPAAKPLFTQPPAAVAKALFTPAVAQATPRPQGVPTPAGVSNTALSAYVAGRGKGSVITMKQVQSRFDTVRGVGCADYAKLLGGLGYTINKPSSYASSWFVTV